MAEPAAVDTQRGFAERGRREGRRCCFPSLPPSEPQGKASSAASRAGIGFVPLYTQSIPALAVK